MPPILDPKNSKLLVVTHPGHTSDLRQFTISSEVIGAQLKGSLVALVPILHLDAMIVTEHTRSSKDRPLRERLRATCGIGLTFQETTALRSLSRLVAYVIASKPARLLATLTAVLQYRRLPG